MSTSDPMTEETEAAPGVLVLPPSVEQERVGSDDSLGNLGRPFDRRSPFFIGLSGAFGVAVAYVLFRGVSDVSSVLVIIGVALFIAIGLNPIIVVLVNRGLSRGAAAAVVTAGFILVIAAFIVIAFASIVSAPSLANPLPAPAGSRHRTAPHRRESGRGRA